MSVRVVLSDERDIPLMLFLWQWKVATSAALAAKFYPSTASNTVYNRLNQLERAGYIASRWDKLSQKNVWTLSKRGFDALDIFLPPLKEQGFQAEHVYHDLHVSAFHLGNWLTGAPTGVEFFSEQQLRRCDFSSYLPWVPKSNQHRPDGYWRIPTASRHRIIALEVEINRKIDSAYQTLGDFYGETESIERVVWLVTSPTTARRIQTQFEKGQTSRTNIHNFVRLKPFRHMGWQAPIESGPDAGKTVSAFLGADLCQGQALTGPRAGHGTALAFLDTRKKHFKSVSSGSSAENGKAQLTTPKP